MGVGMMDLMKSIFIIGHWAVPFIILEKRTSAFLLESSL